MTTVSIATVLLSAPGCDCQLWDLLCLPMSETQTKIPKLSPVQKANKQTILPPAKLTTAPLQPTPPVSQSLGKKPGSPVNSVQLTHRHQRHGLQVLTVMPGESLCVSVKSAALLSSYLGLASSGLDHFSCNSPQMTHG